MSAWQLLVVYDLRYPDAWQLALEHGRMWGRLYADIHPLDSDHIAVVFRSGGERWRDSGGNDRADCRRPGEEKIMAADPVEIINQRNAEVAQIRGYADLTEEAKERRIAEASERAQAEYAEARETREREIRERAEKAEKALFEAPYPYAASDVERAQVRALRRGAYESVYNSIASDPDPEHVNEELDRLLTRAERTQDPKLADAVYHIATERGVRRVADAYLEKRPQAKRRWEEFVAAQTEASELQGIGRILERGLTESALSSEAAGIGG